MNLNHAEPSYTSWAILEQDKRQKIQTVGFFQYLKLDSKGNHVTNSMGRMDPTKPC